MFVEPSVRNRTDDLKALHQSHGRGAVLRVWSTPMGIPKLTTAAPLALLIGLGVSGTTTPASASFVGGLEPAGTTELQLFLNGENDTTSLLGHVGSQNSSLTVGITTNTLV